MCVCVCVCQRTKQDDTPNKVGTRSYLYVETFLPGARNDANAFIITCCISLHFHFYQPPTTLREGNVFSHVCHSVQESRGPLPTMR